MIFYGTVCYHRKPTSSPWASQIKLQIKLRFISLLSPLCELIISGGLGDHGVVSVVRCGHLPQP